MNPRWIALGASLSVPLAAAASCSSGPGGAGGTTSSSSSTTSSGSVVPPVCGGLTQACCDGDTCFDGLACAGGKCLGPLGYPCGANEVCASGACTSIMRCSAPCVTAADCPPGPEWDCGFLPGAPTTMCRCQISGAEVCDGRDNDCDGKVDVGADDCKGGLVCQGGACVCPPEGLCGGVCKDIANDPQNCGGCGVVCGGACSVGHCIEVLAADAAGGMGIAVDDTSVYWTTTLDVGKVLKIAKTGGAPVTLASDQQDGGDIAVDGSSIFWINGANGSNGAVMAMPKSGGTPVVLAGGQQYPSVLAVDATHVFWINGEGALMKVPKTGGASVSLASEQYGMGSIAVDATHVYWGSPGAIMKAPKGGGAAMMLAPAESPSGMAVDATRVFWGNVGAPSPVMAVDTGGGVPVVIGTADPTTMGNGFSRVVLDDTHAYWTTDTTPGFVAKAPKAGGATTLLAKMSLGTLGVAVDATHVYWAAYGGALSRTKK